MNAKSKNKISDSISNLSKKQNLQKLLFESYQYIEENYFNELNLSKIASKSFLSEFHFHRLFKAQFGFTPKEFLILIRNEKAIHLLLNTQVSIADISFEVGFENTETMIRSFKKHFGITPGEYRKIKKKPDRKKMSFTPSGIRINSIDISTKHLLCLRFEGHIEKISHSIRKILDMTLKNGLYKNKPFIGRFLDNPKLSDTKLKRIDIGLEIDKKDLNKISYPFYHLKIPEGKYLQAIHKGNPQNLEETYSAIYLEILNKKNISLTKENPIEIYHKIPPFYPPHFSEIEILIQIEK